MRKMNRIGSHVLIFEIVDFDDYFCSGIEELRAMVQVNNEKFSIEYIKKHFK